MNCRQMERHCAGASSTSPSATPGHSVADSRSKEEEEEASRRLPGPGPAAESSARRRMAASAGAAVEGREARRWHGWRDGSIGDWGGRCT